MSSAEACFDILGATRRGGATSYYLYDQLGSTGKLLDSSQAVTDSYSYFAFGDVRTSSGSTANPFKFVGRLGYYSDASTPFQYLRARYYAPAYGRFVSRDPVGRRPRYLYVRDGPLRVADPMGRDYASWHKCFVHCCDRYVIPCANAIDYGSCVDALEPLCSGLTDPRLVIACEAAVHVFCALGDYGMEVLCWDFVGTWCAYYCLLMECPAPAPDGLYPPWPWEPGPL